MSRAGEGFDLHVRTWGDGGPRILLIHGLASSGAGWWRLGPDLARLGFTVVAPDLRGHGDTPPADTYDLASQRADIAGLAGPWDVVVGHSFGGAVALSSVLGLETVSPRALVLVDPWLTGEASPAVVEWLVADFAPPVTEEAIAAANPRWAPGDVTAKVAALTASGPEVVESVVRDVAGDDLWPELARLTIPTLLIGADPDLDAVVGADQGAVAAANPLVRYRMIPGASHSPHRTVYEPFLALVRQFLLENVVGGA